MFQLLKKRPWRNLVDTLTTTHVSWIQWVLLFYTLLLPTIVVFSDYVQFAGIWIQILLNLLAAVLLYYLPRYLRSGNQLLSLHADQRHPLFTSVYHTVLKLGSIFAVVLFSYTAIVLVNVVLQYTTGITQSQELPDLSHMTFFDITYSSLTAGLTEEVWRMAAIIVTLRVLKKIAGNAWAKKGTKGASLLFAFLLTSFVFGWLHSFGYSDSHFSVPITLQLGLIGMVLASISILTRRLWLAVFFHFIFDFNSFTINAKGMHLLESEKALTAFVEKNIVWFMGASSLFFFLATMFFLSIYFLRFSKGGKKVHQNVAP